MLARTLLLAGLVGVFVPPARAEVKPHPLFADNMVLQRDAKVPVWGTADPGEIIDVTATRTYTEGRNSGRSSAGMIVEAGPDGAWKAVLPPLPAGTGYTLKIAGKNGAIEVKNVAVGDVWLCSGQSNMEWRLSQLTRDDQGKKAAAAAADPDLRLFVVPNRPFHEPQKGFPADAKKGEGLWLECKPETVINFSAVGYFFGRDIRKSQNVPVGLIAADWGGTPCEAWTSKEKLSEVPGLKYLADKLDTTVKNFNPATAEDDYKAALAKHKETAEKAKAEGKAPPRPPIKPGPGGVNQNTPTALFNGMVAPLIPFPVKGVIWYQGESNGGRGAEYRTLLPAMIADWRARWGTEFPFLVVQLAPFKADGSDKVSYAEVRDAQFHATKALPKVGLAVITDAGEEADIHPQEKEPVGRRLALAARAIAYGEAVEFSGPVFKEQKVEGDKIVLTFDHVGGGLACGGEELAGFAVCGEDKVFHPAKAEIKGDTVVVTSDKVANPVAVRFGWVNFAKPELNFFNKQGLPAVPFRTDDFPLTSAGKK